MNWINLEFTELDLIGILKYNNDADCNCRVFECLEMTFAEIWHHINKTELNIAIDLFLKGNSGIFNPRPYVWHEIRSSTHREQFGESQRPSEDI